MTFAEFEATFKPLPRGVWPCPWLFGPGRRYYMTAVDSTGLAFEYREFHDAATMETAKAELTTLLNLREPPHRMLQAI
jgi:hypothetical protein